MLQQSQHVNVQIVEGPITTDMFGLVDTVTGLNLVNLYYHRLVAERHPNLAMKFVYLKYLGGVDPLNIRRVDGGKESEQVNVWVYVTAVITPKATLVVNGKPKKVSLVIG